MADGSRAALKEWAAVERALVEGRTTVLVRKGGIHERRGDFQVEHRGFWLLPTHWHQNPHELTEGYRALLAPPPATRDEVAIRAWARVEDALRVESLDALLRLGELQPFSDETIRSRFAYRGKPWLHAIVVRTHVLPMPVVIPNTLDYEGCVSWVELDDALPTGALRPAMDDAAFRAARAEVLERLGSDGVVRL